MRQEIKTWYNIEELKPPYDTLVLVRGKDKEYGIYRYALASNLCYRPQINMCQVVECKDIMQKYDCEIPFEIEEWMEIEQ